MPAPSGRSNRQQLLVEAAELMRGIDQMDFKNPVARLAVRVGLAQPLFVAGTDGEALRLAGRVFMREVADQMSGGWATKLPAALARQAFHEIVQRTGRELRLVQILCFAG